jgi:hypothetical protein
MFGDRGAFSVHHEMCTVTATGKRLSVFAGMKGYFLYVVYVDIVY